LSGNGGVISAAFVEFEPAQVLKSPVQLGVQVLPLAHPLTGQEACLAEFAPLVLRAEPLPFVMHRVPDFQEGEEI